MRILITGVAGFLGSWLAEFFLKKGWKIIGIDNFITGERENLISLKKNPNFEFIEKDVTQEIYVEGEVEWVLHFASPASPRDYQKFPIQTLKVGGLGTLRTLGLAKKKGAKYLLASTSEIYGDPLIHPQREEYYGNVNPVGPRGVYDEAKRYAEALVMAYHRYHGLKVRIARIFNTYGPRMRKNDGRVIPAFILCALKGEPLSVFGDGTQTRSFCYVDDFLLGIEKLMQVEESSPVNLGNPEEVSIKKLAELILSLTGSKSKIKYLPLPKDDPRRRRPDIARARKLLGWEPKISLEEGLKRTIDWFKSTL